MSETTTIIAVPQIARATNNAANSAPVTIPSGSAATPLPTVDCTGAKRVLVVIKNTGANPVEVMQLFVGASPNGALSLWQSAGEGNVCRNPLVLDAGGQFLVNLAPGEARHYLFDTHGVIGALVLTASSTLGTTLSFEVSGSGGGEE